MKPAINPLAPASAAHLAAPPPLSALNQNSALNMMSPPVSITTSHSPPPVPAESAISNTALTTFWSEYLATFEDEINWDTFFLFIIDTLKIRNPYKLDTDKLRKKMDLKMSATAPTLRKVYQMIQDKTPQEFFSRYIVKAVVHVASTSESALDESIVGSQADQKAQSNIKVYSQAFKDSSTNLAQIAIQMDTKATAAAVSGPVEASKNKTWIYVCIAILILIGVAAVVVYLFFPPKI